MTDSEFTTTFDEVAVVLSASDVHRVLPRYAHSALKMKDRDTRKITVDGRDHKLIRRGNTFHVRRIGESVGQITVSISDPIVEHINASNLMSEAIEFDDVASATEDVVAKMNRLELLAAGAAHAAAKEVFDGLSDVPGVLAYDVNAENYGEKQRYLIVNPTGVPLSAVRFTITIFLTDKTNYRELMYRTRSDAFGDSFQGKSVQSVGDMGDPYALSNVNIRVPDEAKYKLVMRFAVFSK